MEVNKFCAECVKDCKQDKDTEVIECQKLERKQQRDALRAKIRGLK